MADLQTLARILFFVLLAGVVIGLLSEWVRANRKPAAAILAALLLPATAPAQQSYTATVPVGVWSAPSSWNLGSVPTSNDYVYIGVTSGAQSSSIINLVQDQAAQYTFLGNGDGTSGTLQLGNFTLSGFDLSVGSGGNGIGVVTRGTGRIALTGTLTAYNNNFSYGANDTSNSLWVSGGSVSTAAVGNINSNVSLYSGSTLTLNSPLNLTGNLLISSGTLNAQGNNITTTKEIILSNASANLVNRGGLSATKLTVNNQAFDLRSGDTLGTFVLNGGSSTFAAGSTTGTLNLSNSSATTSSTGNLTRQVSLDSGSTLTLNTNLALSSYLNITGSTVDARNNAISAGVFIKLNDSAARLLNRGNLTTGTLFVTGQPFDLRATDTVGGYVHTNGALTLSSGARLDAIELYNSPTTARSATIGTVNLSTGTILTVKSGQTTGLSITGTAASALNINDTSKLQLEIDGAVNGWALRWANPAGGDHVADLTALIASGKVQINLTNGGNYFVSSNADGFTYVFQPVPEPLMCLPAAWCFLVAFRWLRGRGWLVGD